MLAAEIVAMLGMRRHPEGGWYVETFRDNPEGGPHGARGSQTAIYFLLEHGDVSAWHRVKDAAEIWHFHAGAPHRAAALNRKCSASTSPLASARN